MIFRFLMTSILSMCLLAACGGPQPLANKAGNSAQPVATKASFTPTWRSGDAEALAAGPKEKVTFSLNIGKKDSFSTQAVYPEDLKYVRLGLVGEGLSQALNNDPVNGDAYVPLVNGTASLSISAVPLAPGKLRIVTVLGFDANKQPLPAFIGKGLYRSQNGQANVSVQISRQGLLTGLIIEEMLNHYIQNADALNLSTIQSMVDSLTGFNTATQTFTSDPLSFNYPAIANMLVNQPTATLAQLFNASYSPPGNVNVSFATPQSGAFGEAITLVVNDPSSLPLTINAGSNSPQNRSFQVTPGSWTLTAKKANGTIIGTTTVFVTGSGQVTIGTNPMVLAGIAQQPVITGLSGGGQAGSSLTITGGGFDTTAANNLVKFGNVTATVTAATTTSLSVTVPEGLVGLQAVTVTVGGQTSNVANFSLPPSITGLSAVNGKIGSSVTLTGVNFDPNGANDVVKFGSVTATVTAASETSLTVTVPAETSGTQNITVTIGSQTSAGTFGFDIVPTLSALSPSSGGSGTSVVLTGTGFDAVTPANNLVKFGSASATVTAATATSLTVTVPVLTLGTSYPVSVTVGSQTSSEAQNFSVKPGIVSLSSTSGLVGNSLTITGTNFDAEATNNTVNFGSTQATVTSASATSLTVTVPTVTAGNYNLTVTVAGQTSQPSSFNILPSVTSLSAANGFAGDTVIISGSGFDTIATNNTVKFGTVPATITAASATSLTVTVPAIPGGTPKVTVSVGGQTSAEDRPFTLQVSASSLSVTSGSIGSSVTITGRSFDPTAANNTVKFGSVSASITDATATSLTVLVPNGVWAAPNVTVKVGDQTSPETLPFAIVPSVTSISPTSGGGGSTATITGAGFDPVTPGNNTVNFGSTPATVLSALAGSLTVQVPNLPFGAHAISVTVNGQTSTGNVSFAVTPGISALTPSSGIGGSSLTITGTSFDPQAANNTVTVGGVPATVTDASNTSLTVIVPMMVAGSYDVKVTVAGQPSAAATFILQPSVSALSTSSGLVGDTVTLTGTGFDGSTSANNIVKFGNVTATVTSASTSSLTAVVPEGSSGNAVVNVTVGGISSVNPPVFAVRPMLSALSAQVGDSGDSLTLTGTGFDSFTPANNLVKFDGVQAQVNTATPTSLTVIVPNLSLGAHTVNVTVGGLSSSQSLAYTTSNMSVTGLSPSAGKIGSTVTVQGGGFDPVPANNIVKFGEVEAVVTAANATGLTVLVPDMSPGAVPVTVTTAGITKGGFNFGIQPGINSLSATIGKVGNSLTITGTGFDAVPTNNIVKIGNGTATVTSASPTSLTVTVPNGSSGDAPVSVTVNSQTGTAANSYTVIPTISALSGTLGNVGSTLTIDGTGFDSVTPTNNLVKLGISDTTVISATPTKLTVAIAGIGGPQSLSVTVGSQTNAESFSFTIGVTMSSLSPASAAIGSSITINGTGFDYQTAANNIVTFRSTNGPLLTAQATVTSATNSSLTVIVPAGANTNGNQLQVKVTVGGQVNPETRIFTVQ